MSVEVSIVPQRYGNSERVESFANLLCFNSSLEVWKHTKTLFPKCLTLVSIVPQRYGNKSLLFLLLFFLRFQQFLRGMETDLRFSPGSVGRRVSIVPQRYGNRRKHVEVDEFSEFQQFLRGMETRHNEAECQHCPTFQQFLRGMETPLLIIHVLCYYLFQQFLRGMETGTRILMQTLPLRFNSSLEVWKQIASVSSSILFTVSIVPQRYGNLEYKFVFSNFGYVSIVPQRYGNTVYHK